MAKQFSKSTRETLSDLLSGLACKTDWFLLGIINPHEYRRAMSGCLPQKKWDRIFKEHKKRQALARLKKKRWIKHKKVGEKMLYTFHENAYVCALKEKIICSNKRLLGGKMSLVVFDFPEVAKKARNAFRSFLKEAGFAQKQLSVWISTKNVGDELRALIQILHLNKWVEVYTII